MTDLPRLALVCVLLAFLVCPAPADAGFAGEAHRTPAREMPARSTARVYRCERILDRSGRSLGFVWVEKNPMYEPGSGHRVGSCEKPAFRSGTCARAVDRSDKELPCSAASLGSFVDP